MEKSRSPLMFSEAEYRKAGAIPLARDGRSLSLVFAHGRLLGRSLHTWARGGDMPEPISVPVQMEATPDGKVGAGEATGEAVGLFPADVGNL